MRVWKMNRSPVITRSVLTIALSACVLIGCTQATGSADHPVQPPSVERISFPTDGKAGEPHLTRDSHGAVLASWIERFEEDSRMYFSRYEDGSWSPKSEIARGDDWFVNWADVPSLAVSDSGTMMAHWLERLGDTRYAYGVRYVLSTDNGESWSEEAWLHDDRSPSEHGFVTIVPAEGGFMTTWLDGNRYATGENEMSVHARFVSNDGTLGTEWNLDSRACDCCPTSMVRTGGSEFVAFYRDRSEGEMRDIALARFENGLWQDPKPLHEDGWMIEACPVNGPSSDYLDGTLGVGWFTMAGNEPTVLVSFSESGGDSFTEPVRIDLGRPTGRVAVRMRSQDELIIAWMEGGGSEQSGILLRTVRKDGTMEDHIRVSSSSMGRAAGYPRMERAGDDVLMLWTEPGQEEKPPTLQSAKISW